MSSYQDKLKGMFYGHFLGDAMGLPFEFRKGNTNVYTGLLEHETHAEFKYSHLDLPKGSVSDDSEITLALFKSIVENEGYDEDKVLLSYLNWAYNAKCMGKNTRNLFKKLKTLKGFHRRRTKYFNNNKPTESNGSLMRCIPLLIFNDEIIIKDCDITNPTPVNRDCNIVYLQVLKWIMENKDKKYIFEHIVDIPVCNEVLDIIFQVKRSEKRIVSRNKTWVLHTLWISLLSFKMFDKYEDSIEWIIKDHKGSDSSTNAAIGGSLIGCYLGFKKMKKESRTKINISELIKLNKNTNIHFNLDNFDEYITKYSKMKI